MGFGDNVRRARKNRGITQEELAKMVGVAKSTITGYEKNYRAPHALMITKIASALDVTGDELLGLPDRPEPVGLMKREKQLIADFRNLSDEGQSALIEYLDTLARSGKYIKRQNEGMGVKVS